MNTLYNLLLHLLTPFALLRLYYKSRQNPAYREHIHERFARHLPPALPNTLWIHTVSVGEFLAIRPLLDALLAAHPDHNLWLTCTTPTGRAQIAQYHAQYPERTVYSYLPYDTTANICRALDHIRPRLIILMETEIWPNLIRLAAKRDIPVQLSNARLSAKSLRGYYRYARCLMREPLTTLRIDAQTRFDARRYRVLGVPAAHITITPNLKYQMPTTLPLPADIAAARTPDTWIAASTHPGEEQTIIAAHRLLQQHLPHARLIIAPRHPERRDTIAQHIRDAGYIPRLRSQGETPRDSRDIYLLDTLGELKHYYRISDLAYIGGSLIPHGGHNPIEALHASIPVIFGRSMYNFQHIRDALVHQPFVRELADDRPETLATALLALHDAPHKDAIRAYMAPYHSIVAAHQQHIDALLNEQKATTANIAQT